MTGRARARGRGRRGSPGSTQQVVSSVRSRGRASGQAAPAQVGAISNSEIWPPSTLYSDNQSVYSLWPAVPSNGSVPDQFADQQSSGNFMVSTVTGQRHIYRPEQYQFVSSAEGPLPPHGFPSTLHSQMQYPYNWPSHVPQTSYTAYPRPPRQAWMEQRPTVSELSVHPSFYAGAQPGSQPNVHCSKDHSYTPLPMQVLPGSQQKMRSEVENMHLEDNSFSEITQMIVRGYPPDQADLGLKLHLSNLTGKNPECTNVYKEGQNVIATFSHPVDIQNLMSASSNNPYDLESEPLAFIALTPTKSVLVSGLKSMINDRTLCLYCEQWCKVEDISRPSTSSEKAVVKFVSQRGMKTFLGHNPHILDGISLEIKPYHPLLNSALVEHPKVKEVKRKDFNGVRIVVSDKDFLLITNSRTDLKMKLNNLKGTIICEEEDERKTIIIKPISGAEIIPDWDVEVRKVFNDHLSQYKHEVIKIPAESVQHVIEYSRDCRKQYKNLHMLVDTDQLVIAGKIDYVNEISEHVIQICTTQTKISSCLKMPKRKIIFLKMFCKKELKELSSDIKVELQEEMITYEGSADRFAHFKKHIESLASRIVEVNMVLNLEQYELLCSQKGVKKIYETLQTHNLDALCEFEPHLSEISDCPPYKVFESDRSLKQSPSFDLWFISSSQEHCRRADGRIKLLCEQKKVRKLTSVMYSACHQPQWSEWVKKLTMEFFCIVHVYKNTLVVTGEALLFQGADICETIMDFLVSQTSVNEDVVYTASQWEVIKHSNQLIGVKEQALQLKVKLSLPSGQQGHNSIVCHITGEMDKVASVKVQLSMLKKIVHQTQYKVDMHYGARKILTMIEGNLKALEREYDAVIECDIASCSPEKLSDTSNTAQLSFHATLRNNRIAVYIGDFTQHSGHAVTILNFLSNIKSCQDTIKMLQNGGGQVVIESLKEALANRPDQFIADYDNCSTIETEHGKLKCMHLIHCIIPESTQARDGSKLLMRLMRSTLLPAIQTGTVLINAPTFSPLMYCPKIFGESIAAVLVECDKVTDIRIYFQDKGQEQVFKNTLSEKDFRIQEEVGTNPVAQSPPVKLRSLVPHQERPPVFLAQGDMLETKGNVYINSTNSEMNLDRGQVSRRLKEVEGKELQEQCTKHAPLNHRQVVVTAAKKLMCKYIFHISLPEFKSNGSEQVFSDTFKIVLQKALELKVQSIVIPSLGVANLGYPASVSAKLLYDGVSEFYARHPTAIKEFHFVIYEKKTYAEFTRLFEMQTTSSQTRVLSPPGEMAFLSASPSLSVYVVNGNIADEDTDVIVNTTSVNLNLSNNAVSKALLRKAGKELQKACEEIQAKGSVNMENGEIAVTTGYGQLKCKNVFHAFLPTKHACQSKSIDPHTKIMELVKACLRHTEILGLHTISFPAFGTGAGGHSIEDSTKAIVEAIRQFVLNIGSSTPLQSIRIVIYDSHQMKDFRYRFCSILNIDEPTRSSGFLSSVKGVFKLQEPIATTSVATLQKYSGQTKMKHQMLFNGKCQAVFTIFALDVVTCESIKDKIKADIQERFVPCEKIENTALQRFTAEDFDQLLAKCAELDVGIEVLSKGVAIIVLNGERSNVKTIKDHIQLMIDSINYAEKDVDHFEWVYEEEPGKFEVYPDPCCFQLHRALFLKLKSIHLKIDNVDVTIDLEKMKEKAAGKIRSINKRLKQKIDLPSTWIPMKSERLFQVVEVDCGSQEYNQAVVRFNETTKGKISVTIKKVERVQNPNEYAAHCIFRKMLKQKYKGTNPKEKCLFHGTVFDAIYQVACQGFNRSFASESNAAHFGPGVYFAVNASYSAQDKYAKPHTDGTRRMFVCNVIIGEYTKGTKKMKAAPELPSDTNKRYDTLVDDESNPTIYVAMKDGQAYPEYVITYTKQ